MLYALASAPNGLRITELGNDVLLTQPGMSRLIARLETFLRLAPDAPERPEVEATLRAVRV